MAIVVGEGIKNNAVDQNFNPKPNLDDNYGPYPDLATANSSIPIEERAVGLTIAIKDDTDNITEYWYNKGIEDEHLVEKFPDIDLSNLPEKGDDGEDGADGLDGSQIAAVIVNMIDPDAEPYTIVEGPNSALIFTLGIPRARDGEKGADGEDGESIKGDSGLTPQLSIGTVETGTPTTAASVSMSSNGVDEAGNPKYVINFVIPKGDKGATGDKGADAVLPTNIVLIPSGGASTSYLRADGSWGVLYDDIPGSMSEYDFITTTAGSHYLKRTVSGTQLNRDILGRVNRFVYTEVVESMELTVNHLYVQNTLVIKKDNGVFTLLAHVTAPLISVLPVGHTKRGINLSSTSITFESTSTVTITGKGGMLKVIAGGEFTLWKIANNAWYLTGDLTS